MAQGSEDDIETRMMTRAAWLPPVRSEAELPTTGVADGTMCYVEGDGTGEEEVWEFREGTWHPLV